MSITAYKDDLADGINTAPMNGLELNSADYYWLSEGEYQVSTIKYATYGSEDGLPNTGHYNIQIASQNRTVVERAQDRTIRVAPRQRVIA